MGNVGGHGADGSGFWDLIRQGRQDRIVTIAAGGEPHRTDGCA